MSASMTAEDKGKKITRYCPSCKGRYTYDAQECATCKVELSEEPPHDLSLFKPMIDVPVLLLAIVFALTFDRLPGEAQSFGLIFLLLGFLVIATRRMLDYYEWRGRN